MANPSPNPDHSQEKDNEYLEMLDADSTMVEFNELQEKFKYAKRSARSSHERKVLTEHHIDNITDLALEANLAEKWDVRGVIDRAIKAYKARYYRKQISRGY